MKVNYISDFPVKRISPANSSEHDYQYFYGYYDNYAFSRDDKSHLCNRVKFMDRMPSCEDKNELCVINLENGEITKLAETFAWNFQQGSMLEWNPAAPDKEILYNCFYDGDYRLAAKNIETGEIKYFERAIADISPNGKYGLSVNFNRVYDFRPGYGYCHYKDPHYSTAAPKEDGVFLLNMESGESKQIISYEALRELYNVSDDLKDSKIVINHITFNTTSDRFLFLVRYFQKEDGTWGTGLGTSDLNGNIYLLRNYTYASHYHWQNGGKILIHANCGKEGNALYELTDLTQEYKIYNPEFFTKDIHCSYSPNGKYIMGDGYPDKDSYRELFLFDIEKNSGIVLGKFLSPDPDYIDIRCDLHARWSRSGRFISFDSIHEGYRGIYTMDLSSIL